MTAALRSSEGLHNPVDLAELVVMDRDWSFDRLGDGELLAEVSGTWCNYKVWFSWQEDTDSENAGALMLSCSFDTKPPKAALPRIMQLLNLANEKIWVGYFVASAEDNEIMFRHSLLIRDGAGTNTQQLQDLLDIAIQECERFYPAFQAVTWGGKSPAGAMEIALFETIAEA